jgi:hypothetical protein
MELKIRKNQLKTRIKFGLFFAFSGVKQAKAAVCAALANSICEMNPMVADEQAGMQQAIRCAYQQVGSREKWK